MSTNLTVNGKAVTVDAIARKPNEVCFTLNGTQYVFRGTRKADGSFLLESGEQRISGTASALGKGTVKLQLGAIEAKVAPVMAAAAAASVSDNPLSPLAPMPGVVRQVLVKKGDTVKEGQPLAVMEAMKLQTTLKAGGNGVVESVLVNVGDMIAEGTELVKLKRAA